MTAPSVWCAMCTQGVQDVSICTPGTPALSVVDVGGMCLHGDVDKLCRRTLRHSCELLQQTIWNCSRQDCRRRLQTELPDLGISLQDNCVCFVSMGYPVAAIRGRLITLHSRVIVSLFCHRVDLCLLAPCLQNSPDGKVLPRLKPQFDTF